MRTFASFLFLAACTRPPTPPPATQGNEITLFFTTELRGTLEPCGCTSDPLGDLARTAALVKGAGRPAVLLDGGSTLYSERPVSPPMRGQEALKATLLAETLPKIGLGAAGVGPYDLAMGPEGVLFPRQAANARGVPLAPPLVRDVGGVKVGVFGVVDPSAMDATDPVPAARQAIAALRAQGAAVVVALAHLPRAAAKRMAVEAPGVDFVLVGRGVDDLGVPEAEAVGGAYLVVPGNRGQVIARVDLTWRGGPLADAIGPGRAAAQSRRLEDQIASLRQDLARWEKDPTADAAFVAQSRAELARLEKERQALHDQPLRVPATGSWFVLALVPIKKGLPCDPEIVAAKQRYDLQVSDINRKASAGEKPPPAPPGKATYVGIEECTYCHRKAVDMWKKTKHAAAWATLEGIHKHWNRECVGCHSTGWLEPGGAVFANMDTLVDVQCETCHGPASLHVDADGKRTDTLVLDPPGSFCATRCHTPEHSDTFQYEAYLRDIVGPGHGAKRRAALGDGPTGHELRSAALEKAGKGIGAHCPR